ncbi:hypothetical protein KC330_g126 [Hortaea werneckii]|nr:hypothetical protein KC330_g126 [Hortaea werneckii]
MPVLRFLGATPETEAGHLGDEDCVFPQWPVVNYDQRKAALCSSLQLRFALGHQSRTPFISARVRIRVQQRLVSGPNALLHRPVQTPFPHDCRHLQAVFVLVHPGHVVVFRSEYTVLFGFLELYSSWLPGTQKTCRNLALAIPKASFSTSNDSPTSSGQPRTGHDWEDGTHCTPSPAKIRPSSGPWGSSRANSSRLLLKDRWMSAMAQRRMLQLTGMVLDRSRWQRYAGGGRGGGGEEDARACRAHVMEGMGYAWQAPQSFLTEIFPSASCFAAPRLLLAPI